VHVDRSRRAGVLSPRFRRSLARDRHVRNPPDMRTGRPYGALMPQTSFVVEAIASERLEEIRKAGVDDGGNPVPAPRDADGGEPLRCCLRHAAAGEQIVLIAYKPFDRPGPYSETGPVFVHAGICDGFSPSAGYPVDFLSRPQVFRCYGSDGQILGGRLTAPGDRVEPVIEELFGDPDVEWIHTRNVVFGCYMLQVKRSG
jgi:hypothetical protein